MRYSLILFLIMALVVIPTSHALAASIGNAKMILRPVVPDGGIVTIDKSIMMFNVNSIPIKATLQPDDNYKKIITIPQDEFILQPNESKKADFTITLKSGGRYEGRILVSFVSADPAIKENKVLLASNIIIIANGTITDEYYRVMNSSDEETVEDITPPIEDTTNLSSMLPNNSTVSIVSGYYDNVISDDEEPEQSSSNNLWVGIIIIVIIVVAGLCIFLIVKKFLK